MTEQQIVDQVLRLHGRVLFFLRPHEKRLLKPVLKFAYHTRKLKELNKTREKQKKEPLRFQDLRDEINIWHFFALELIEILTLDEGRCRRPDLEKIFLWKFRGSKNKFDETVMQRLEAVGLIEVVGRTDPNDRRAGVVRITRVGKDLIEELRAERRTEIETIVKSLRLGESEADAFITRLRRLSSGLWKSVKREAKIKK